MGRTNGELPTCCVLRVHTQRDDTGETSAVEIVVRGRHEEIDFGNQKQGDDTETSVKTIWS